MELRSGCDSAAAGGAAAAAATAANATAATITFLSMSRFSEMIEHMRLPPARIAGIELRKAVDTGVVEAHYTIVLVGDIFDRGTHFILATGRSPEQPHVTHPESPLRHHRRIRQIEPEVSHVV